MWYKEKLNSNLESISIHLWAWTTWQRWLGAFGIWSANEKLQFLISFFFKDVCRHFASAASDNACSADAEVWEGKKTLLSLSEEDKSRLVFSCLPSIHYSFHEDAGEAAADCSTLWSSVTSAALGCENLHPAQRMGGNQDKSRNMLTLDKLVPLGFWVSGWIAAIVAASWKGGLEHVRAELHFWNFKEKLDYWGRSKVGRKVLMR